MLNIEKDLINQEKRLKKAFSVFLNSQRILESASRIDKSSDLIESIAGLVSYGDRELIIEVGVFYDSVIILSELIRIEYDHLVKDGPSNLTLECAERYRLFVIDPSFFIVGKINECLSIISDCESSIKEINKKDLPLIKSTLSKAKEGFDGCIAIISDSVVAINKIIDSQKIRNAGQL